MKHIRFSFLVCSFLCLSNINPLMAQEAETVKVHEIKKREKQPTDIESGITTQEEATKKQSLDAESGATTQKATAEKKKTGLYLGGYGEAVVQRMFYSDDAARYSYPASHKNDKYGRVDLPHVVFFAGYDFGRGWKMAAEVEFEHGGSGATIEIEKEEGAEYETEIEKGGEVVIEQFWIEKSFKRSANLRLGHLIVPIGLTNMYHMPTEFFSALRPEEEMAIIPCTWHETGISFWGEAKKWRYEAMIIAGLDAERFSNAGWISGSSTSPYEFKIANSYATAARVDNSSVKGLRMGFSGYFGFSAANSLRQDRFKDVNGAVTVGAFDAVYDDHNILARTNIIYGHLSDSYEISLINRKLLPVSPSPRTHVASDAMSWYVEAGYDLLSFFPNRKIKDNRLYIYGHYGYYDSMHKTAERFNTTTGIVDKIPQKGWCKKQIISAGLNYFPMKGLVIKAEYMMRKLDEPYNNEPSISLGIGYSGLLNL